MSDHLSPGLDELRVDLVVPPPYGSVQYQWFRAGCEAEARERKRSIPPQHRESWELVEVLFESYPERPAAEVLTTALIIQCAGHGFRARWRRAWRLLRG